MGTVSILMIRGTLVFALGVLNFISAQLLRRHPTMEGNISFLRFFTLQNLFCGAIVG